MTVIDCPDIAGPKAPIAPVLNTPLDIVKLLTVDRATNLQKTFFPKNVPVSKPQISP